MPSERRAERLSEILSFIERVEVSLAELDVGDYTGYLADTKAQDILERNILRIAEAASKIGFDALETLAPGAPWRSLYAMANRLRHGYDRVDHAIVWDTWERDFPVLMQSAQTVLSGKPKQNLHE
ncbi:MAG: DUF86 domain-containing protein [Alphaproteobacteria bacterium]|nr:DUF86 domain-containing protein [Alphaproteobacteria bacterium]